MALDPGFAQAWARVSCANSLLYANSTPTPALAERARQAAEKAVALAPNRPEGYLALGNYERLVSRGLQPRPGAVREGAARRARRCLRFSGERRLPSRASGAGMRRWSTSGRRSASIPGRSALCADLGDALLRLRRYPEAREALDRGLALAPANLALIEDKAMTFLGEGDLAGARAVLKAAPKEVEPTALVAFVATYCDLVWVLDEEQRELLLRLTPSAFDDDRGTWALCLAQAYALKGDAANVRTYAEEARKAFEEQLRAAPDDAHAPRRSRPRAGVPRSEGGGDPGGRARRRARSGVEGCAERPLLSSTSSRGSTCSSASRRRRSTSSSRC